MTGDEGLTLSPTERAMLAGEHGEAVAMCMRLVVGVARAGKVERDDDLWA